MANPLNNSFENWTGATCDNWTTYSVNDGVVLEETSIVYDGSACANCRSSRPAPVDSIGGCTSDAFALTNDYITFWKNDQSVSVAATVRIFDASDVELAVFSLPQYVGWKKHCINVSSLKGQNVKIRFEQHTTSPGAGYYTLIDLVECTDTPDDCYAVHEDSQLGEITPSTATASGYYSSDVATNAIDNNDSTRWHQNLATPRANAWVKVDLGSAQDIGSILVRRNVTENTCTFNVDISTNDSDWTNIETDFLLTEGQEFITIDASARYIRISNFGGVQQYAQIFEIRTYESGTVEYTASFEEQNALDDVEISIYSDSERTTEVDGSPITTAGGGLASLDLENGTYYYTASKLGYDDLEDSFTISDDDESIDITMIQSWLDGWTYRKKITIDHDDIDATLTNFTTLVKLTDANFNFAHAESDGIDIRFTSADGKTLLPFEREFHGEYLSSNLADYFVQIPSVSSSEDTYFYMYYGNDSAEDYAYAVSEDALTATHDSNTTNTSGVSPSPIITTSNEGWGAGWKAFDKALVSGEAWIPTTAPSAGTPHWLKYDYITDFGTDLCTGGTASADSQYSGDFSADKAFDDNLTTTWSATETAYPHWLKYDFGEGNEQVVNAYSIVARHDGYQTRTPNNWKFQGSNNDSDWTDLDEISDGAWGYSAQKAYFYDFSEGENTTAYRYYRLYCTGSEAGGGWCQLNQMEMFNATIANVTEKSLTSIVITNRNSGFVASPRDFKFQGSKNGINWDDLLTVEDDSENTSSAVRPFDLDVTGESYSCFRLRVTDRNGGDSYVAVGELEFYETVEIGECPWDSNYKAIYHLKETCDGTTDEIKDTSGNAYDLTGVSPYLTSDEGFIYKGLTGGSNGYAKRPSTDTDLDLIGDFVLEWKMKWDSSVTACSIMGKSQGGGTAVKWVLNFKGLYSANTMNFMMGFGGSESWVRFDWVPSADTEYNCALRRDGNNWKFFVNGVQVDDTQVDSSTVLASTQSFHLFTDGEAWQYYAGLLDEVRITKGSSRSDAYITATYLADTNALFTFGAEMLPISTEDLYPKLEWITKESDIQLTPSLEWLTKDSTQLTPSLQWLSKYEHRFCPNLINYEFDFLTPTIYTSKNTASVSGILHSLAINMKDTGSSGSTIISLYLDNVLIKSKTITADNDEYSEIEYFDMTNLIYPKDSLEIRVTQVATGADDLKICIYEMTFPFALQNAFMGNIKDSTEVVSINRAYLFNNADYWTIDFNQPLNSVSLVTATNVNGDTVTLTNEITDGDFYNSRIKITPSIASNIESISIKAKDLNNQNYSFILYPTVTNYMSDYPSYVFGDTAEIEVFTPATYFKYSFDSGVTWSEWGTISSTDTMTIDFSEQTEGQKTLTVRYRNGSKEFEEDVDIYYVLGDIDCAINYVKSDAKLSYTDAVPLDRVEVYYDDVLSETLELNIVTGMNEIDLNTTTKKLTVNAGYIYRNNQTYYFDGTALTINPDFASNGNNPNWRYILVFNLNTNVFEWKEEILVMESDAKEDVKYEGYIVIAIVDIVAFLFINDSVVTEWGMINVGAYSNISNLNRLGLDLNESKVIKIRVIDVVGRTKDFSATYNLTKYNIWRELTVSKGNIFASSYDGVYYPKYIADVDGSENIWRSDSTESLPQWVRFDCGIDSKKTVKEYSLTCYYVTQPGVPKSWKLQGSNDASNWTDLHEVSNETSWTSYSSKTYTVDNNTAYAFYRLYVTAVVSGTVVNIYWLRLRETVGGDNFVEYAEEELLPGQIHQSPQLELDIETEDWTLDDTNGVT